MFFNKFKKKKINIIVGAPERPCSRDCGSMANVTWGQFFSPAAAPNVIAVHINPVRVFIYVF